MVTRRAAVGAVAALLGATLFWAGNYVVGAAAVETLSPLSLTLLRWAIAAVPLLILAQVIEKPDWRSVLRSWPWLFALSVTGMLGYNLLLYSALAHTSALNASLINAFNPALITLAAALFLRERLTARSIGGVALALIGVMIVLSGGDLGMLLTPDAFGWGEVAMLGAIVAWTAYTIIGRRGPRLPAVTSTAAQAVIAVVALLPFLAVDGAVDLPDTMPATFALLYIAVFPSILSYLLWNRALEVIPPGRAGVFLNLITVFTAILTLLLGQPVGAAQVIGGGIIIVGIALASTGPRDQLSERSNPQRGLTSCED